MSTEQRTQSAQLTVGLGKLSRGVVRVLNGPSCGQQRCVSPHDVLVVGSGPEASLRLADRRVSRLHAEITLAQAGFVIRDRDSRNGTWFEGARVGEIAVRPGSIVRLGETHLLLTADEDVLTTPPSEQSRFGRLCGTGVAMRQVFTLLERAARAEATVLLVGESGTGKELAARALHERSARASEEMVIFDCAGVPPTLAHAALFGYERGAFTGATNTASGALERAHGSTLFIDGIEELPIDLQPLLLRFCDRGESQRLGGEKPRRLDVRLVVATRADLPTEIAAKRFREDLYYRLSVLSIELPPLRRRREDLPILSKALIAELTGRVPQDSEVSMGENLARLEAHDWPGNVRELRNVLERALAAAGKDARFDALALELSPRGNSALDPKASFQEQKRFVLEQFERDFLRDLLERANGNVRLASRMSGLERTQLKRMLRRAGLT